MRCSPRCAQAVTTNYDTLYEAALGDARVVVQASTQWLLEMHGDISRPSPIILSRSDFVRYAAASGPMGAVVQSLLMTNHFLTGLPSEAQPRWSAIIEALIPSGADTTPW